METLDVYTIENGMEKVGIHDVCKVPCLPRLSVVDFQSQAYVRALF